MTEQRLRTYGCLILARRRRCLSSSSVRCARLNLPTFPDLVHSLACIARSRSTLRRISRHSAPTSSALIDRECPLSNFALFFNVLLLIHCLRTEAMKSFIQAAILVAKRLSKGASVHIMDAHTGSYCTVTVVSLALLLVDPQYRTHEGFVRLFCNFWLHKRFTFHSTSNSIVLSHLSILQPQAVEPDFTLCLGRALFLSMLRLRCSSPVSARVPVHAAVPSALP